MTGWRGGCASRSQTEDETVSSFGLRFACQVPSKGRVVVERSEVRELLVTHKCLGMPTARQLRVEKGASSLPGASSRNALENGWTCLVQADLGEQLREAGIGAQGVGHGFNL
jgi:hypothetical protein